MTAIKGYTKFDRLQELYLEPGLTAVELQGRSSDGKTVAVPLPTPVNISSKTDKGGYSGTSQDLNTRITNLLDNVATEGNTLKKLFQLINGASGQVTKANITERNAYDAPLGIQVFVLDDGDGDWALYKATTAGVGAMYAKLSDPHLLNAVMSIQMIKSSYESNPDTNAFTNALLAKLNGIQAEAEKNVQSDMLQNDPTADDFIKNRQVSIPYRAKIMWSGSNDFTIPTGVVVLSAHKNGSPADINWSQTGNVVTHLGPAMVSTDYMMIMGAYSPATYFSGGGIVQSFNQTLLIDRVATTSPIIPAAVNDNEATNLGQVQELLLGLRKLVNTAKTAVNGEIYNNFGDNTYTDPTGVLGKGYWVYIYSGIATIGDVQFGNGTIVIRTYDGTVWKNDVFVSAKNQIEFSGNTTVSTTWFGKEVTCIGSGILTMTSGLPDEFNFTLRAEIGVTMTWAKIGTDVWRVGGLALGVAPPDMLVGDYCQVSKRKGTNQIRITGL